jgi:hypothetical protein
MFMLNLSFKKINIVLLEMESKKNNQT